VGASGVSDRDPDLERRAIAGDPEAFATLVAQHRRLLDAACATVCPNRNEREDALQQALIDIWRGLGSFKGESLLTTWMFRVAQNAARRHVRRALRSVPIDADADPSDVEQLGARWTDAVISRSVLLDALEDLPDDHRDALIMHTQAGMSLQEIADIKFAAVGTVKSWLHRARADLIRQLGSES